MKKIETIEYTLPDWIGPYAINDDPSGLTDDEIEQIDKFIERQGIRIVDMLDDSDFKTSNDLTKVGDTCSTFIAHKINNPLCGL
jgi:hypothetical protein